MKRKVLKGEERMKSIRVVGVGLAIAAFGCNSQTSTEPPRSPPTAGPTSAPTAPPSPSSVYAALMAKAEGHAAIEGTVTQENIVADEAGKAAATDPHLKNAWGLAFNPAGPAWVSANGNGTSQVYDDTGKVLLEVTIPPPAGGMPPSAPTGQVFNPNASSAFMGDLFIFATEDGTIAGWQRSNGGTAVLRGDNSGSTAIYKGITIASPLTAQGRVQLYAADFHNGKIDVWDDQYMPVTSLGGFSDPDLPAGFAPFNVRGVGPLVLVSYAKQDENAEDDVKGPGNGFVDVFSAEGFFLQRLISGGHLNSPWAMLFAPDNDRASIDIAIGNFGDGMINIYNLSIKGLRVDARWEGALGDTSGKPLVIDGLWALEFGSGASGFEKDEIYFTAGPNDEANGLFGSLAFTGNRK
jgi:uncharacterized protein (TIGR03118 family)